MYYLTEEDYARAKTNGISHQMAYNRYYRCNYDLERALTEEPGSYKRVTPNTKLWDEWKDVAEKNDISKRVFINRMNARDKYGKMTWTAKEAATHPKGLRRGYVVHPRVYELAKQCGIKKSTFRNRVFNLKWNPVRAATEPVKSLEEERNV